MKIWNECEFKAMSPLASEGAKHPFFHITLPDGQEFCCTPHMLVMLGNEAQEVREEFGLGKVKQ